MTRNWILAFAAGLIAVVGWAPPAKSCTRNSQCPYGSYCDGEGFCAEWECMSSADCATFYHCANHNCLRDPIKYTSWYMSNWDVCEQWASPLSYTDDQVNGFDSYMTSHNQTRLLPPMGNSNVWSSRFEDDYFGGVDWQYTDAGELFVFSGHGGTYPNGAFYAPMCYGGDTGNSYFFSTLARYGEPSSCPYGATHPGYAKWAIWLTCYSVDENPYEQWHATMDVGMDYIMGYRGTSCDSSTTASVPADWASSTIWGNGQFKAAWFWAVEDWWCDDTGAVLANGTTQASADSRRDNLTKNYYGPHTSTYEFYSVAYHGG